MKITKLVILFNKDKILFGATLASLLICSSKFISGLLSVLFLVIGILILLNILLAIGASYFIYDKSDLYNPAKLFDHFTFKKADTGALIHASFDPVSSEFEKLFSSNNFDTYNIYGNRHEDESAIKIAEKVFPPNKKEIKINPCELPCENNSLDYIFAITSLHEIMSHNDRVQFFNEAKRVLKNNGTLIVCEQMRDLTNFLFFNIGAFHFISIKKWRLAIKESGLKITNEQSLTPFGKTLYIKA